MDVTLDAGGKVAWKRWARAAAIAATLPAVMLLGQAADPSPAVFVPDSSKAAEQFRLAERLEGQREWAKAADVYQEIVDTLGDRVMPVAAEDGTGGEGGPRYETVARQVERQMSRWPEAGLRVYRERFERAASELASDDDPSPWSQAVDRYFVTTAALEAGKRLIDHRIEQGDLGGAESVLRRLLGMHPKVSGGGADAAERAGLLARAALVSAGLGDAAGAEAHLGAIRDAGGARLTLGGRAMTMASLEEAVAGQLAWSRTDVDGAAWWRMPGGTPARNAISTATAKPTARVGLIELPELQSRRGGRPVQPALLQQQREQDERARRDGSAAVIYPAADGGQLFFQDGSRLWGVSIDSGLPLAGWVTTHTSTTPGVYTIPRPVPPVNSHQYSVTLTADSVLAVMGFSDVRAQQWTGQEVTPGQPRVVRLDRETGRVVWEAVPRQWPESFEALRGVDLSGSPVVVGDSVFVAARGSKGNQFNDAYVVCLDYETGRPRWITFVASAAGSMQMWMDGSAGAATVTHLAAAGGRVFFQTNLGAVAALDAVSGRPEWITTYARDGVADRPGWGRNIRLSTMPGAVRPWSYNPPIVSGGLVFSLPTDGRELLILDATDGRTVKRIPMAEFDRAEMLLHANAERVIVASENAVFAVDWQKHRTTPLPPGDEGYVLWRSDLAGSAVRGRPFVTQTALFVPTQARLLVIDPSGGKALASVPDYGRRWEGVEGQGHVIAAGDHLVIAGMGRVEIHTDLTVAEARYREDVAARPTSPEPRLRWAEVMFNAGRLDEAAGLLSEAAELIAAGHDPSGAAVARLYASALSMGDSMARQSGVNPTAVVATLTPQQSDALARARAFYQRAAAVAATPVQHVEYRRRLASILTAQGSLEDAAAVWQEVLSTPAYREVAVQEESGGYAMVAGRIARREIGEIVRRSPGAYARFEREAADKLAAAMGPAELIALAQQYPNSRSAPEALFRAAERLEVDRELRSAERVLRELFVGHPTFSRRAEVAEAMARVALATPGRLEVAQARLAMGGRLFPTFRLTTPLLDSEQRPIGDAPMTFAEAAAALRPRVMRLRGSMPDVRLPSDQEAQRHRQEHRARIEPVRVDAERNVPRVLSMIPTERPRADLVPVQLAGGELGVVRAGGGLVWKARSPGPLTTGAAWTSTAAGSSGGLLLAWDERSVTAYAGPTSPEAGETGTLLWRMETDALPAMEVARGLVEADDRPEAAGDDGAGLRVIRQGNQQIVIRRNAVVRGNVLMNMRAGGGPRPAGEAIVRTAMAGERLLVATASGRILCLHPGDGSVLWQTRATASLPDRLLAGEDFVVVISSDEGSSQISALDAETGTVLWRRTATDPTRTPINAVLSPDGMLVYTLPDRICGKDLFDPGEALTFETSPDAAAPFLGMTAPRQLVLAEGVLLAATDQGQYVRAFSLAEQGRPVRYASGRRGSGGEGGAGGSDLIDALFATRTRTATVTTDLSAAIHVAGTQMYVMTSRSVVSYELVDGVEHWHQTLGDTDLPNAELFITAGHVLTVSQASAVPGRGEVRVQAMSRARVGEGAGRESGLRTHEFTLGGPGTAAAGGAGGPGGAGGAGGGLLVRQVQPVEGGLYFLTLDSVLQFARGTAGR